VGVRGSGEALVHAFNRVVEARQTDGSLSLLQLDFQNAFNLASRTRFVAQIRALCPDLLPYVLSCYGGAAHLFVGHHLVSAQRGVHQGDPLAPLIVALAIHPFVRSLSERFKGVLQGWYLDDGKAIGDTSVLRALLEVVITEGPNGA
jgi:hypothetical protein